MLATGEEDDWRIHQQPQEPERPGSFRPFVRFPRHPHRRSAAILPGDVPFARRGAADFPSDGAIRRPLAQVQQRPVLQCRRGLHAGLRRHHAQCRPAQHERQEAEHPHDGGRVQTQFEQSQRRPGFRVVDAGRDLRGDPQRRDRHAGRANRIGQRQLPVEGAAPSRSH